MDKKKRAASPAQPIDISTKECTEATNTATDTTSILEGILHNLFDGLSEKDQFIRTAIENALVKIMEIHPVQATDVILKHLEIQLKHSEEVCSIIIHAIERMVDSDACIPYGVYKQLIAFALELMTESNGPVISGIQKQGMNILVAIARDARDDNCALVMDDLMRHSKEGVMPHFMIMECYGTIAATNVMGVVPFVKPILKTIGNQLASLKQDHLKRSYAFAIGRFSEALLEQRSVNRNVVKNKEKEEDCHVLSPTSNEVQELLKDSTEISVAYDVLYNQWLSSRDSQVCLEVLKALSSLFPLLPQNKIQDQTPRLVPAIFNLYRRSMDRNAVTQFLSSVLETNLAPPTNVLDGLIDQILSNLFDRVSVAPHYDKPYTLKGHYEVLRCFDLLSKVYAANIMDTLLMHLRSNSERERIKSLLIFTHLLNTALEQIQNKLQPFLECLKAMITSEKTINMKKTLQRCIVALSQKSFIKEKEFVWFLVRHSCKYNKMNEDYGSREEYDDLMKSCENSLFMLSTTAGTMDELLKRELLNYFVLLDYTDICWNLAGCLASLFGKSPNIEYEILSETEEEQLQSDGTAKGSSPLVQKGKIIVPSAETIYTRCLALLGNNSSIRRSTNILSFLKFYYPHLNPELANLWEKRIPDLLLHVNNKEDTFHAQLAVFITETNNFLNLHDEQFAERLVHKMADEMLMYPLTLPPSDFVISPLHQEKAMLLKCLGLTLCHVKDAGLVAAKIDLIITAAKQERLDKNTKLAEFANKIQPCATALGYTSRTHLLILNEKLNELIDLNDRKHSTGFFSNLNFMKDTHKELEKTNLLVIKTIGETMMEADPQECLSTLTEERLTSLQFLIKQLKVAKDTVMLESILKTLLQICEQFVKSKNQFKAPLKYRKQIMDAVFDITITPPYEDLPMLPSIFKLGSHFVRLAALEEGDRTAEVEGGIIFEIACSNFFTVAQNLKTKFESPQEDEFNSFLAQHLNASLPELNVLVRTIIEMDPSPSPLGLIFTILEPWLCDENAEVRTCACRVFNNCLDAHIKTIKLDDEDVSKFTQTGQIMAKIVPRCIDSNATVRQVSVEILQKTLVIATLTLADNTSGWLEQIELVKEQIITDDPKKIYQLANEIANIIAERMSSFQYLQFCKTILQGLKDPEQSSAMGSAVVLKFFIEQKGSELFHAVPDLVNDGLAAIRNCKINRAKLGVLKGLVALTKHHPKLMMNELLTQKLPYEENVMEYWRLLCTDSELTGIILDDFLQVITTSSLLEDTGQHGERQNIASVRSFSVFCALHEMMPCIDINKQLNEKFPELFVMLLTTLATYTNVAAPMLSPANDNSPKNNAKSVSGKYKFGFIPNKDTVKLNPCQIVLETLQAFLKNLEMHKIADLLDQHKLLATSSNLKIFIELLKDLVTVLQTTIDLYNMDKIVQILSNYVSSTYEGQRVTAVGFYASLIHLRTLPDVLITVMQHCCHALSDPNPIVRGLSIQGMGYVNGLGRNDIDKYIDVAINALLKGIDDFFSDGVINIPLESMRGLSRVLVCVPNDRIESIQVSLGIRLRPFFGNYSLDIRETSIILFGNLCERSSSSSHRHFNPANEALREQLLANLFPLLLHLSESETKIANACKTTLIKVCNLLNSTKVKDMAEDHLNVRDQLNYQNFIVNFVKIIAMELNDHIQDFIDSCIPNLRSHWPDVRASAAIVIGILNNFLSERNPQTDAVGQKIATLLKDNNKDVRINAATALGYFYGDI